jgi:PiT family inorganic phosphate transporter
MTTAAIAFAVAIGATNGATLVVLGLRGVRCRPWLLVSVLAICVSVGPALIGTHTASTFATGLVDIGKSDRTVTVVATAGAVFATLWLAAARGLPTSSFIAAIGGLAGAGLGTGRHVHWWGVISVTAIAMAAPAGGLAVAYGLTRARTCVGLSRTSHQTSGGLAFGAIALAYSASGAQLILAMFALTSASSRINTGGLELALVGSCFFAGTVLGLRRIAIGNAVLPLRPIQATRTQLASALTMGGLATLGIPASVTQVATASVVGCGVADGAKRVRWQQTTHIAAAWVLTLPTAFALGSLLGVLGRSA